MLSHSRILSILTILCFVLSTTFVVAQTQPRKDTAKITSNSAFVKDTTIRGTSYPMYRGAKGGMYIIRVSKTTGNTYKQYLKKQ